MKRIILILCCFVLLPISSLAELAELPDISGLSFVDLIMLKNKIDRALWKSEEWEMVEVPPGVYEIGVDIPEGHWTIAPIENVMGTYIYTDRLDEFKKNATFGWKGCQGILSTRKTVTGAWKDPEYEHETDIEMTEGMYIILKIACYFMPYTGKTFLKFHRRPQ